ncbi:MAG TPA: 50S ribosomal protein L34e [Candidatus Nanoarchaeia archaeon]|nr:50S ribosomal protein L34e [Candidatus Nanoarchaeia archaeon]
MVNRQKRSRTLKRISVKTPGGKTVVHFRKPKPGKAHCASCKRVLEGVPRVRAAEMMKLAKTERRPERPYAGMLCSTCMRRTMVARARAKNV